MIPSSTARSNTSNPFVNKPNVDKQKTRRAFLRFNSFATSIILSPEEIISSMISTSLPSNESPRNSWATIGLRPSITVE